MRLLLSYAHDHTGKEPHELDSDDLDAPPIGTFLSRLETVRGNSVRTRNNRLAAIHSLYRYAALRHPEHAQTIARVISTPTKRGFACRAVGPPGCPIRTPSAGQERHSVVVPTPCVRW